MNKNESLKDHWTRDPQYFDKWVAQRAPKRLPNGARDHSYFDDTPLAVADDLDELIKKLEDMGYDLDGTKTGSPEVVYSHHEDPDIYMQ